MQFPVKTTFFKNKNSLLESEATMHWIKMIIIDPIHLSIEIHTWQVP